MSAFLALVAIPAANDEDAFRKLLVGAMHGDACTIALHRPSHDVMLGVASPEWDEPAARRLAADTRYTVVAHAALFYRTSFNGALAAAGQPPITSGASAADVILTALNVWGARGVERLEGEFSFIAWDAREHRLIAARDHGGSRPLFFSRIAGGVAAASALRTVRRVPGCSPALNLIALAEDVADVDLAVARETAYAAIERLPAGHSLAWTAGKPVSVARWWEIPVFQRDSGLPFAEGALELRRLLADAVRERSDLSRGTAVMLSGGYDSTAIYAAGNWALGQGEDGPPLRAVSLTHPVGDPGREDELIGLTTEMWGGHPHWVSSDGIPAIDNPRERARRRDEPFSHSYELWNRALALGCRDENARIALNGNGGDPWFSASPLFLADLLRRGHLLHFRREWKLLLGRMTWHRFFKVAVQPNLSPWMLDGMAALRGGRAVRDPGVRPIPEWMADDMRTSPSFLARRQLRTPRRPGEGLSAAEQAWFLEAAFPERTTALVFNICQQEGVELRTPLLDQRVVRFAATRPRWESNSGRQNKHLLRRSMEGLLPPEVVAPRASRTGLPTSYLERTLLAHLSLARSEFVSGMLLADHGIVSHRKLLSAFDDFLGGSVEDGERAVALVCAIQAEWWLRSE